jgi:hypothetical protein
MDRGGSVDEGVRLRGSEGRDCEQAGERAGGRPNVRETSSGPGCCRVSSPNVRYRGQDRTEGMNQVPDPAASRYLLSFTAYPWLRYLPLVSYPS